AILALTFKEDVPDLRNSRIPAIVNELTEFGVEPLADDPLGNPQVALAEDGVRRCEGGGLVGPDARLPAVAHRKHLDSPRRARPALGRDGGAVIDVKAVLDPSEMERGLSYWSR